MEFDVSLELQKLYTVFFFSVGFHSLKFLGSLYSGVFTLFLIVVFGILESFGLMKQRRFIDVVKRSLPRLGPILPTLLSLY